MSAASREQKISVWVGVLAVALAICSLAGTNAQQDAMLRAIETANGWAFFQARNIRREVVSLRGDEEAVAGLTKSLDALYHQGKALEVARDKALAKGPWFEHGAALLQIAIVLASVAMMVSGRAVLAGSAAAGALGTAAMVAGFAL